MAIEMSNISFNYGAVQALDGVDFSVERGKVVALVGDNGAGKSTLIKVLAGVLAPDSGEIVVDGEPVSFGDPVEAREHGIETLYQDLSLLDNLDVRMNFFIGREDVTRLGFLRHTKMFERTREVMNRYTVSEVEPSTLVHNLSGGQRQVVALARAMRFGTKYIILDEPTSSLSPKAADEVLGIVRGLADQGYGVVIITHNVEHAFRVADHIVVLRVGRLAGTRAAGDTTPSEVVSLIVGADEIEAATSDRDTD